MESPWFRRRALQLGQNRRPAAKVVLRIEDHLDVVGNVIYSRRHVATIDASEVPNAKHFLDKVRRVGGCVHAITSGS
jgi:hypothetical protein